MARDQPVQLQKRGKGGKRQGRITARKGHQLACKSKECAGGAKHTALMPKAPSDGSSPKKG
jgi:hypothetical protein